MTTATLRTNLGQMMTEIAADMTSGEIMDRISEIDAALRAIGQDAWTGSNEIANRLNVEKTAIRQVLASR